MPLYNPTDKVYLYEWVGSDPRCIGEFDSQENAEEMLERFRSHNSNRYFLSKQGPEWKRGHIKEHEQS